MLVPAAVLAVLVGCSPASDRGTTADTGTGGSETGMASTDTGTASTGTGMASTDTGSESSSVGGTVGAMDASGVLSQLAVANQAEIQQAKAAAEKATASTVKQYANQLVKDHKANSQKLKQVATKIGATVPDSAAPSGTESQSASMGELAGKSGKEFDQAFIDAQIQAHEQNIDKIRNQLLPASDQPELRDYLQQTASALEGHLAAAKQLKQDLSGGS
jgi:putative membrane protein